MKNDTKQKNRINDYYGGIKLLMAIMIAVGHYDGLVQKLAIDYTEVDGYINKLISLFLFFSVTLRNSLPIVFFILSGIAIYKGYYYRLWCVSEKDEKIGKQRNNSISFKSFIVRRIERLYPTMWVSICVWAVADNIYMYHFGEWWTGRSSGIRDVVLAMTGISVGTIFNEFDRVNGPIWYISVLMVCYVLFFVMSCLYNKLNQKMNWLYLEKTLLLIPICVGLAVENYKINLPMLNPLVARGCVGFFFGILLMRLLEENKRCLPRMVWYALLDMSILVVLLIAFRGRMGLLFDDWDFILCFIVSPAIVVLFERYKNSVVLDNRISNFMGRISFPFFLIHMPIYLVHTVASKVYGIQVSMNIWRELLFAIIISILLYNVETIVKCIRSGKSN